MNNNDLDTNQKEVIHDGFIKFYKFLLFDDTYNKLSNNAKFLYVYITNICARLNKSTNRNQYLDINNTIYFEYDRQKICDDLNIHYRTVTKIKKELIDFGLIKIGTKRSHIIPIAPTVMNNAKEPLVYSDKKYNENSGEYIYKNRYTFFKLPKSFFEHPKYKMMPNLSKMLYSVIYSRHTLSITNTITKKTQNYKDNKGNTYCVYSNESLMSLFNISEPTLIDHKKVLIDMHLLSQESKGFNVSNRLFVHEPQLHYEEKIELQHTNTEKIESKEQLFKSIEEQIFKPSLVQIFKPRYTVFRYTALRYTINVINDMYDMYIDRVNTDKSQSNQTYQSIYNSCDNFKIQDNDLTNINILKNSATKNMPYYLGSYLNKFELQDIRTIIQVLSKAKSNYNNYNGHSIKYRFEDIEHELIQMLMRYKAKIEMNNETVQESQSLLMTYTKEEFRKYDLQIIKENLDDSEDIEQYINNKIKGNIMEEID